MDEVIRAMIQRRSIRKYKADAVPEELLARIVQAGLYAASGRGGQSAIIAVVTEKSLRDRLAEMNCAVGYMDGELPPPSPRNGGRVFWAKG